MVLVLELWNGVSKLLPLSCIIMQLLFYNALLKENVQRMRYTIIPADDFENFTEVISVAFVDFPLAPWSASACY